MTYLAQSKPFVIPAQAGIQGKVNWIPACAGMTARKMSLMNQAK